ncbi:FRG domain-containing protein [Vibrio sp. RM-69-4]|uniref:FRG domain-containing protein n=1 Tax=Vibrio sp. RM-69-4 TaxID=2950157 RepID=UPI00215C4B0F|nr:FRG domain-containing protein [Vibrio sp. RM-69-4]MCR9421887.1 FRG domain-containing protein [Vibrio sp. RM-69-4]
MIEITEFLKAIDSFGYVNYYRGHADVNWKLIPSLARTQASSIDVWNCSQWADLEVEILRAFEKHGCSIIETPPRNQLEWLIHAQHHGLPTRLLDWSSNPLKALFFAVENPALDHLDGVVFGASVVTNFVMDKYVEINQHNKIIGFHSSSLNKRVAAQEGCFTLTPIPDGWGKFVEVEENNLSVDYLRKYEIPKEHKPVLRKQLKTLGITHQFLFPDFDGLAMSIKRDFGL